MLTIKCANITDVLVSENDRLTDYKISSDDDRPLLTSVT